MKRGANPLGELELKVMEELWSRGEQTVRGLCEREPLKDRAYTTIMTTTDRLYRKGLLRRRSEGNAYMYWPKQDRSSYWQSVSQAVMAELMELGGAPTLTAFVDAAEEHDQENLSRLEAMLLARKGKQEES